MVDHSLLSPAVIEAQRKEIWISLGGTRHRFKLTSAETGGQFAVMEAIVEPHTLVIPHKHHNEDELTFVLEGEGGVRLGDQEFTVQSGAYIFIPRGTPHAIWNATNTPGKAITLFSPAGLETYFEQLGAVYAASNPPDFAKLGALGQQYGIEPVMEWVPELSAKYNVRMG